MPEWPTTADDLIAVQEALATERPEPWEFAPDALVAGCFVTFPKGLTGPGAPGDPVWAGAAAFRGRSCVARATATGTTRWRYQPGLLALRIGPVLERVVRDLSVRPDVLLVDATGRDHPRRCGLAVQLGAALSMPTVGVTHRTLLTDGALPADERGATSPLVLGDSLVAYWVRTRPGRRPIAVHAGWRTDPDVAVRVVLAHSKHRTARPIREARRLARLARAAG
ncbi:MAG: endonuclease V [Micromonosporaceae bacterium]